MSTRYPIYIATLALIFALGIWFLFPGNSEDQGPAYSYAQVKRGDLSVSVSATGTLNPVITVQVGSQVSGTIQTLNADFNSRVHKGQVFAPLTTVQRKLMGITHIDHIEVQTAGRDLTYQAIEGVKQLLRERHRLQPQQEDDFRIHNRAELAQASEESAQVFTYLLGSIASVSLLVGVFFGLHPARKAARMKPIKALRYE